MLGPYRNLTTLTASIAALHQNCQVLNHAGDAIFADPALNFFNNYTPRNFNAFVRFALWSSTRGEGGQTGGSIVHSHAFQRPAMKEAYEQRYGDDRRKAEVRCLLWKESLRTNNLLKESQVNLAAILGQNTLVRFLMPIRFPLDCARSNINTGHVQLFRGLSEDAGEREVLNAILDEISWFFDWQEQYPQRFFYFYQHLFDRDRIEGLAAFLELPCDETWVQAAMKAYSLEASYSHTPAMREYYRSRVEARFAQRPEVIQALLEMNETGRAAESARQC